MGFRVFLYSPEDVEHTSAFATPCPGLLLRNLRSLIQIAITRQPNYLLYTHNVGLFF